MRIDELRTELHAQADATRDDAAPHRLAEVQDRVRHIRRRRAAAASVGTVAAMGAVAAIAVVPAVIGGRTPTPEPADTPSPWVWPEKVAGDTLVAGAVGERGQSELLRTFTLDDTDVVFSNLCDTASPTSGRELMLAYAVNGQDVGSTGCSTHDSTVDAGTIHFGDDPAVNRSAWADTGLRAGEKATVHLWIEDRKGRQVEVPGVRIGFALYERTAPRIIVKGVTIPELIDARGETYRLTHHVVEPLSDTNRAVTLRVPASDRPRQVLSGVQASGSVWATRTQTLVDGEMGTSFRGGGFGGGSLPGRGPHTLGVREKNPDVRGSLVITVYERAP
jgi:hypothetical protein